MSKKIIFKNKQQYNTWQKKHKNISKEQQKYLEKQVDEMLLKPDSKSVFGYNIIRGYIDDANGCFAVQVGDYSVCNKYKEALRFGTERNQDINLQGLQVYEVPSEYMDKIELMKSCGGCYIPSMQTILIKTGKSDYIQNTKIDKLLGKYRLDCNVKDVFVHELFHAISHVSGRQTRKFSHLEEEFVYKSTIDWFLYNGFTNSDIVDKYFLPFTLQDVMREEYDDIVFDFIKNNYILSSDEKTKEFLEDNAEKFVDLLVNRAKERGMLMLNIDNRKEIKVEDRFSVLDFD